MSQTKALLALLALVLVASVSWAAQTQTSMAAAGLPGVVVTAVAQSAEVLATDQDTLTGKLVHVVSCTTVDGYPFVLLVRVQKVSNGLFIDIVGEATIGELTTRVAAMAITGNSHPSTEEDAADTAALAAAAD